MTQPYSTWTVFRLGVINAAVILATVTEEIRSKLNALIREGQSILDSYTQRKAQLTGSSSDLVETAISEIAGAFLGDVFSSGRAAGKGRRLSRSALANARKKQLEQMIETVSSRVDNWFSQITEFLGGVSTPDATAERPNSHKLVSRARNAGRYVRSETRLKHGLAVLKFLTQLNLVGNSDLKPKMPKGMVTKPGEEFKAYAKVLEIISDAAGYLKVVDPYPNVTTLVALARAPEGLSVRFLTVRPRRQNRLSEFEVLVKKLMYERPEIEVRSAPPSMLHDRFILSKDGSWSLGQSIKDIGNKLSLISPLLKADATELEKQFDRLWDMSEPAAKS
jgi:hypothetical protein